MEIHTASRAARSGRAGRALRAGHSSWPVPARRSRVHRGITAFIVDLRSPGVDVRSIDQANGHDELAEVTFDDVLVPADRLIGTIDGGWSVAMHILSSERGTFAWFRRCFLLHDLQGMLHRGTPEADGMLGDAVLDLAGVGALSMEALHVHENGAILGPRAAFTKLVLCAAEQGLFDWALASDPDVVIDPFDQQGLDSACRVPVLADRDRLRGLPTDAARHRRQTDPAVAGVTVVEGRRRPVSEQRAGRAALQRWRRRPARAGMEGPPGVARCRRRGAARRPGLLPGPRSRTRVLGCAGRADGAAVRRGPGQGARRDGERRAPVGAAR